MATLRELVTRSFHLITLSAAQGAGLSRGASLSRGKPQPWDLGTRGR